MTAGEGQAEVATQLADGAAALAAGRWDQGRVAFETALARQDSAEAHLGLASVAWWTGENRRSVAEAGRAYSLFRLGGDVDGAVRSAVWLAITYKANFANLPCAAGWLARADRLLASSPPGLLHGWTWVARAYRLADLDEARRLTGLALEVARKAGDVDLELVAMAQMGLIRVGQGAPVEGFALIDEAMAAALAGERSSLDTVVFACCDMLNACELASDIERAARWCAVADEFVATYGCPFLYAECRISYGAVLAAKGRWEGAERELAVALRTTDGTCPGLHARALARLAELRLRQGRLEEAAALLAGIGAGVEADAEQTLASSALMLARGEAGPAGRHLGNRLHRMEENRWHLASALALLIEVHVTSGDLTPATERLGRLAGVVDRAEDPRLVALGAAARGRVAACSGDIDTASAALEEALALWSRMDLPFEAAAARCHLAETLAAAQPEVAADHARRALSAFEALGAPLHADRAAALLRSLGATPRTGHRAGGGLTAREQEVLRLVGAGLTNPEIATRIHVSRKTAAHHVSSVLAKLGLRNRAEAAAYAASHGETTGGPPAGRS